MNQISFSIQLYITESTFKHICKCVKWMAPLALETKDAYSPSPVTYRPLDNIQMFPIFVNLVYHRSVLIQPDEPKAQVNMTSLRSSQRQIAGARSLESEAESEGNYQKTLTKTTDFKYTLRLAASIRDELGQRTCYLNETCCGFPQSVPVLPKFPVPNYLPTSFDSK